MDKKGIGIGMFILMFMGIVISIAFFGIIVDTTNTMTEKQAIVNEAVDISSARLATGAINTTYPLTVTNAPTGWKVTGCPLESVSYGNSTTDYTLTTDYTITASSGVLLLKNTVVTNNSVSNSTFIDYTYCADGYNKDSSSRSILNLLLVFCALVILAFVLETSGVTNMRDMIMNR